MLLVDDKKAVEIQRTFAENRPNGWEAISEEEKRMNKKLNLKLDLLVSPPRKTGEQTAYVIRYCPWSHWATCSTSWTGRT